jgi:phosphoribosylglycinamide formyltransferase 1
MNARGQLKLAVLISGRGSNMTAVARACQDGRIAAQPEIVISNRADAGGISAAKALGLNTAVIESMKFENRALFEAALIQAIEASGAQLLVLAGFMRILSPAFVHRYAGRLINIHPSLLPHYRGLNTHQRALQANERDHGASVHFVTEELDGGPVICQARVAVRADDTEQTLSARVLMQEHRIYPMVIGLIANGRLQLQDGNIVLDGQTLAAPLTEDGAPPQDRVSDRGGGAQA